MAKEDRYRNPPHYHEIAGELGYLSGNDEELISAIEGASVTAAEWDADPQGCLSRVRGALEEMDNG